MDVIIATMVQCMKLNIHVISHELIFLYREEINIWT